jgi:hypothetical protein
MKKTALLDAQYSAHGHNALADLLDSPLHHTAESSDAGQRPGDCATLVGKLIGFAASGLPLVDFEGNPEPNPLPARHTCTVSSMDIGREAVLLFERDDICKPILLGFLQLPSAANNSADNSKSISATLDGKQVTLTAENEIVLRCGKASITLTRAGKVLINGEYLLSKSNGVNRIKGGSVQIN